jgi:hypothetical protein
MNRPILHLGFRNRSYQLGTGIHSGWEMIQHWLENTNIEKLYWRDSGYNCITCGTSISVASVPAPVSVAIFRCKNGHKFSYENTDCAKKIPRTMYPSDTDKLHYRKHKCIWQVKTLRAEFFVDANRNSVEEKILEVLKVMNLSTNRSTYQFRKLPVVEVKKIETRKKERNISKTN